MTATFMVHNRWHSPTQSKSGDEMKYIYIGGEGRKNGSRGGDGVYRRTRRKKEKREQRCSESGRAHVTVAHVGGEEGEKISSWVKQSAP